MTDAAAIGARAAGAGIRRVHFLAWRDLEAPDAGGSEIHAERVAEVWAAAGIEVTIRTGAIAGASPETRRTGCRVIRRGGRYDVFPRAAAAELLRMHGPRDALVECWGHGMPFFAPLWSRGPKLAFLHHHQGEVWDLMLPPMQAKVGRFVEEQIAPRVYARTPIVTLSESSKQVIVEGLGLPAANVTVAPPGVDPSFTPGGERSPDPLVVAVGRLVPIKQYDRLIAVLGALREHHPGLRAVIVGEGDLRPELEAQRRALGADDWIDLPGRVTHDELLDLYRRAWVVASPSAREGWGMTLTEAAATGTPVVATRIAGHTDATVDGVTGYLVDDVDADFRAALDGLLSDPDRRARLGAAGIEWAGTLTWAACASRAMDVLVADAARRRR